MSALKDHYAQFSSDYLLKRRTLGGELSDDAHGAIEGILEERGERPPPRIETAAPASSAESTLLALAGALMRRVAHFLGTPAPPLWKYCLIAAPLALVPSLAAVSIVEWALRLMGVDARMPTHPPLTPFWMFFMVVLGPALETLALAGFLWVLKRVVRTPVRLAAVSAILWGLLHGLSAPIWFFGTVWSFFVFSHAYIAWRERSRTHAFVAAAVPHGLVNLAAVALIRSGF